MHIHSEGIHAESRGLIRRGQTLRLGVFASLFSALIFSAANLADVLYINPDAIEQAFNIALSQYSSMLDSNSLTIIENFKDNMPMISFFSNFIYSSILSRYIPKTDPFAGFHNKEENSSDIEEQ